MSTEHGGAVGVALPWRVDIIIESLQLHERLVLSALLRAFEARLEPEGLGVGRPRPGRLQRRTRVALDLLCHGDIAHGPAGLRESHLGHQEHMLDGQHTRRHSSMQPASSARLERPVHTLHLRMIQELVVFLNYMLRQGSGVDGSGSARLVRTWKRVVGKADGEEEL